MNRAGWLAALGLIAALPGCGRPEAVVTPPAAVPAVPAVVREKLLDGAVAVLDHLDHYDESAAAAQVFDRLNQWSHAGPAPATGWKPDPLAASLPEALRPLADDERLARSSFDAAGDVTALRDTRWLAAVARQVRSAVPPDDDLAVAAALFQWTIRGLAPVSDPPMVPTAANPGSRWMLPGEILLAGRASPAQRAWIFLELLRQAGIDGVMLATGDPTDGTVRPWIPAVVAAGEAYLFEPAYGMPIPGPGGVGIATARQAARERSVLEALSLPERGYPVQASDMERLTVLVAADPWTLSRRMADLAAGFGAGDAWSLTVDASGLAARARAALPAAGGAALWTFPWETLVRRRDSAATAVIGRELAPLTVTLATAAAGSAQAGPRLVRPLLAARIREFRGDLDGPDGAKASYLAARPSRQVIGATVAAAPPPQADAMRRLFEQMKEDATYWLGVLTLGEGEYEAAADYLGRMTLTATPDGRWADAARVNLAAALAALGRADEAAALWRADTSPQRFGSRLRAAAAAKPGAAEVEAEAGAAGRPRPGP